MKKVIAIVEIPATDFSRAVSFYKGILDIEIEEIEMGGIRMGLFPNDGEDVFVQVIQGAEYRPSADGVVVYFNCGDDLQKTAIKIEAKGGRMIVPKTEIGPEMGFYAMFTDSEGNKLGLHSTY